MNAKVMAIALLKGGVGKTLIATSLGAGLFRSRQIAQST